MGQPTGSGSVTNWMLMSTFLLYSQYTHRFVCWGPNSLCYCLGVRKPLKLNCMRRDWSWPDNIRVLIIRDIKKLIFLSLSPFHSLPPTTCTHGGKTMRGHKIPEVNLSCKPSTLNGKLNLSETWSWTSSFQNIIKYISVSVTYCMVFYYEIRAASHMDIGSSKWQQ